MQKLVFTRAYITEYGNYEKNLPFEYESKEKFLEDFSETLRQYRILKEQFNNCNMYGIQDKDNKIRKEMQKMNLCNFAKLRITMEEFLDDKYDEYNRPPEVYTLKEWFEKFQGSW